MTNTVVEHVKRKIGRPPKPLDTMVTKQVLTWIEGGNILEEWCSRPGRPKARSIRDWLSRDATFGAAYARARLIGADVIASRMRTIASTPTSHPDDVQHRRLQIDTDKWLLARWFPTAYGDRLEVTSDHSIRITLSTGVAPSSLDRLTVTQGDALPLLTDTTAPRDTEGGAGGERE